MTQAEIERRLLLAGDTPGVILRSTLAPGQTEGGAVLVIDAKYQAISETLAFDNSLSELIDRLCSVDLLHIDDVGAEQTTSWVLEQLYTVVNTRYEDRRAMILTTNLIEQERKRPKGVPEDEFDSRHDALLRHQIGDRTVSRLYEMCGTPWPMFGGDKRLETGFELPPAGGAEVVATRGDWTPDLDDWDEQPSGYGRQRAPRRTT